MSLADRFAGRVGAAFLLSALLLGAGCTVRPLYGTGPGLTDSGTTSAITSQLASISVKQVDTRVAQEVRNHLIFLFNGGAAESATPRYSLQIGVTAISEWTATVQINTDDRPTAAMVTMVSTYVLTNAETGETVAAGRREISSSYDVPHQEFAAMRAQRDAENRAARELAELLRLAVAQDLSARGRS